MPLLALGLIYGIGFSGVWEARRAAKTRPYVETAKSLAALIDDHTPVVCDCPGGAGRTMGYNLSLQLGRPVQRHSPANAPHYLVMLTEGDYNDGTTPLLRTWRYGLWLFDEPPACVLP